MRSGGSREADLSVCRSVSLSLFVCPSLNATLCLSLCLFPCLFLSLCLSLSVCLCVCVSVHLCVCVCAPLCVSLCVFVCATKQGARNMDLCRRTTCWTSNVHAPWMTTYDGKKKEMNRKHPVSRPDSAFGARSSSTRISVLVGKRQVVDEIDFRLCVRH